MKEIDTTVPGLAPKPYGYGRLRHTHQPTCFFICEFVNISDALPDPIRFGARLTELHKTFVSPTGRFGFYIPTYDGKLPQITA